MLIWKGARILQFDTLLNVKCILSVNRDTHAHTLPPFSMMFVHILGKILFFCAEED